MHAYSLHPGPSYSSAECRADTLSRFPTGWTPHDLSQVDQKSQRGPLCLRQLAWLANWTPPVFCGRTDLPRDSGGEWGAALRSDAGHGDRHACHVLAMHSSGMLNVAATSRHGRLRLSGFADGRHVSGMWPYRRTAGVRMPCRHPSSALRDTVAVSISRSTRLSYIAVHRKASKSCIHSSTNICSIALII
jgi:hypothetical protein